MIGKQISHYSIDAKLGQGGMGVVYKATDTILGRNVALKFLPPNSLGSEEEKARFFNEARAAAALDHANICTIYEIDECDNMVFIAMGFVPGKSLKQRMASGPCEIHEAIRIAMQIADGLQEAHQRGIVHRDLKPANVMLTEEGQAVILDFGLAKLVGGIDLTQTGTTLGTIAYMSPEQARGEVVDHRSDIWSFGVLLYEILTGQLPFISSHEQVAIHAILNCQPVSPKELRADVPEALEKLILQCLQKDPEARPHTFAEVGRDLGELSDSRIGGVRDFHDVLRWVTRPRIALAAIVVVILLAAAIFFPYQRLVQVQVAKGSLAQIESLAEDGDYFAAYELMLEAEKILGEDETLERLRSVLTDSLTVISQPEGAQVTLLRFDPREDGTRPEPISLGVTPIEGMRIARSDYRMIITRDGYLPAERMVSSTFQRVEAMGGIPPAIHIEVELFDPDEVPQDMLFVLGSEYQMVNRAMWTIAPMRLDDYFIDRFEVSNRDYKTFITGGGYLQADLWQHAFVKDGKKLTWDDAMRYFIDRSGLPGPRDWMGQDYPEGKGNHPVTGVSWYEASAYAEFAGKSLPTVLQWEKAARDGGYTHMVGQVMPWGLLSSEDEVSHRANFDRQDTVPVDSHEFGLSPFGCYNMAGNVKEWCLNQGVSGYVATGGSWGEPSYLFTEFESFPGFHSSRSIGFRCVSMVAGDIRRQGLMRMGSLAAIPPYRPVNAETYQSFLSHYRYDQGALDVRLLEVVETDDWHREKLSFAGLGGDRIIIYLYLPKRIAKPFQCIQFIPGSDIFYARRASDYIKWFLASQIKAGRAVMAMVPKGGVEREWPAGHVAGSVGSVKYRDEMVHWSKEFSIGLDYLESRGDIDMGKLAHVGFSWGAGDIGIIHCAIEKRYGASIFIGGGIDQNNRYQLPEVNSINFASRIDHPKLILHGLYDEVRSYRDMALPLYELLTEPKTLHVFDGGHAPSLEISAPVIKSWLDKTFGPVRYASIRR